MADSGMILILLIAAFFMTGLFFAIFKIAKSASDRSEKVLTCRAKVVSKRMYFSAGETGGTEYFVTLELPEGERMEFSVNGSNYGLIAEGDVGEAQSRGKRLVGFTLDPSGQNASDKAEEDINDAHKCSGCGAVYVGRVCPYCDTPFIE